MRDGPVVSYQWGLQIAEEGALMLCYFPIRMPPKVRASIPEFLMYANMMLPYGKLVVALNRTGDVMFQHYVPSEVIVGNPAKAAEQLFEFPAQILTYYAPGILAVLSGVSPRQAFEDCGQDDDDEQGEDVADDNTSGGEDIVFSKVYEKSDNSGTKKIGTASVSYGNENGKSFDSDAAMLIPLVRQIAEAAAADMIKSQVFHVIACTSEGELTVDLASSLIKEGDKLDIFSRGKNVVSARSGMNKREEVKMGSLRVVEAQPSYCKARFEIIEKIPNNLDVIVRVAK